MMICDAKKEGENLKKANERGPGQVVLLTDRTFVPRPLEIAPELEYLRVFGLKHNPFPVAPDDVNFYLSGATEEIVAEIVHGICSRKGFIILTGEVGLGKTTISRRVITILNSQNITTSLVLHTSLKEVELLRAINRDFGLPEGPSADGMGKQLERLNDFLLDQYAQGRNCAIIVDDAQNLDYASLELIRMISNLEANQQKLVQILLVGQTELLEALKNPRLRQLSSRIVIRKRVRSLSHSELRNYILYKLIQAGDSGRICITPSAFRKVYQHTGGNLRLINLIMDRCLYALRSGGQKTVITHRTVAIAVVDLKAKNEGNKNRRVAWVAVSLIFLFLLLTGYHFGTRSNPDAAAASVNYSDSEPLRYQITNTRDYNSRPVAQNPALPNTYPPGQNVVSAVVAFLNEYQLTDFGNDFCQALSKGQLSQIGERIYSRTGLQLIELPIITPDIRQRYGVLAYSLKPNHKPAWLLFYRPQIILKHFYYDYRADEIRTLQKRFAELELYQYDVDGIVGTRLMKAVVKFQQKNGLPVTGFPDPATIFQLYHQKENPDNV